jgi:L-alanine-DL-glutamate epimerase-like enolase superfamily enzyme
MTLDAIARVETFIVRIPREVPYLGPLRDGEFINEKGYLVRKGNRSIYPSADMSVLVRVTGESGEVGWGETYGIAAPEAVTAIIDNLLAPVIRGRCPSEVAVIWEDLYDLMRVRGFFGGYYVDALAGVDIALWDLFGRRAGLSVAQLLGGARAREAARLRFGPAGRDAEGALRHGRSLGRPRLSRNQVRRRHVR